MLRSVVLIGCLLALVLGFSDRKRRDVIFSPKAPPPIGPYSQAIRSKNTVYVSGQIALRSDGILDTSSIENECRQVLENIRLILEASGKSLQNVDKASVFLTDLRQLARINAVYQTYFPVAPPARETIEVRALPKGAHLEISVIAN